MQNECGADVDLCVSNQTFEDIVPEAVIGVLERYPPNIDLPERPLVALHYDLISL